MSSPSPHVCIIGAGSSGIASAKTLHERGIPFDCFEKGSGIGGNWRYNNDNRMSSAYQSLHINTSRDKMAFSDFPMPKSYSEFPHHTLILKYFEKYVDHFGFRDKLTFQTSVDRVEPLPDGGYEVTVTDRDGQQRSERYSAVLVANGHHWSPRHVTFPGQFTGESMHSHYYKTLDCLIGKRVLVVGIGNSACDIACEASRVAEATFLSTRNGAHVIPKYMFGIPMDKIAPGFCWKYLPHPLFRFLFGTALRLARGPQGNYGFPTPKHKILQEHPTISSELLNLVGHGRILMKPNISELQGDKVKFVDDSVESIDLIVYCTGYQITFPFLDSTILNPANNEVPLYRNVVHPDYPGLYFIGLVQPWGAIMPLAELQSKWVADLLEGRSGLPSTEAMKVAVRRDREKVARRYVKSDRHTIQVDYYPYEALLKKERKRRLKRDSAPAISEPRETTVPTEQPAAT